MTTLVPFPNDFAPYDKDASKATTGTDNVFRFKIDAEGYVAGAVTSLTPDEASAYRDANKPVAKKVRKRKAKKQETA